MLKIKISSILWGFDKEGLRKGLYGNIYNCASRTDIDFYY